LPFEGCGVISEWELSLNDDPDKFLRLFDYDSITDAIVIVKFGALEDEALKPVVQNYLKTLMTNTVSVVNPDPANAAFFQLWRGFSLRYDFSNEWYRMTQPALSPAKGSFIIDNNRFPHIAQNRKIRIKAIHFYALVKEEDDYKVSVGITATPSGAAIPAVLLNTQSVNLANTAGDIYHGSIPTPPVETGQFNIEISRTAPAIFKESNLKDLILVLEYQLI
jgi:hypothetical protein